MLVYLSIASDDPQKTPYPRAGLASVLRGVKPLRLNRSIRARDGGLHILRLFHHWQHRRRASSWLCRTGDLASLLSNQPPLCSFSGSDLP